MLPVGFGDQSRQFAEHVGEFRQPADTLRPGIDLAALDRRLGQMIKHEALAWETLHKLGGDGKVFGVDQDIVSKIELLKRGNSPQKFWLQQEPVVRLTLHDVADPDELRIPGKVFQLRTNVRGPQVSPANDTENRRRALRQLKKPACLFHCLACLNGY